MITSTLERTQTTSSASAESNGGERYWNAVYVRRRSERAVLVALAEKGYAAVKCGERVATIPESEIDSIRRVLQCRARLDPWPSLAHGECVRIVRGPMTGSEGI
jgi:hypothetical protein